jgi:hypothetical protein
VIHRHEYHSQKLQLIEARQCSTPELIETPRATLIPAGKKLNWSEPHSGQLNQLVIQIASGIT